jgi:hypothetical protein
MKQIRTQNLGINFLSNTDLDSLNSLDLSKLWMVPATVLTETYVSSDEKSWYRKYSDGWIEQAGTFTATTSATQFTATFSIPFKNTPLIALRSQKNTTSTSSSAYTNYMTGYTALSSTSISMAVYTSTYTIAVMWYVAGY